MDEQGHGLRLPQACQPDQQRSSFGCCNRFSNAGADDGGFPALMPCLSSSSVNDSHVNASQGRGLWLAAVLYSCSSLTPTAFAHACSHKACGFKCGRQITANGCGFQCVL
jgi:hypothetical protein